MGTKVHCKSYLPGYYYHSMRDLNEDSSSSSCWPVCYGDNATANGQYYNGFVPRTIVDGYPGYYGKDALKQKMLEHEAIFKNQVYELHRLYRIQRDMMDQYKRKGSHHLRASMEQPSSSSSLRGSQMPSQDARKRHVAGFPVVNPGYNLTSISGLEIENSPVSCTKGYNPTQSSSHFPFQNGVSTMESEPSDSRPLKVRKKLFDLQLPADEYVDTEEDEKLPESTDLPLGARDGMKTDCRSVRCADLNEPIGIEEAMAPSIVGFIDRNRKTKRENTIVSEPRWFSHLYEAGSSKSNVGSITNGLQKENLPTLSYPVPGTLNRAPGPDPFSSSCFSSSRPHAIPPWANPTSSFTQKSITVGSCLVNASPKSNPAFGFEITAKNGFYHGSASGMKETNVHLPSSAGFDYLNRSRPENNLVASDRSYNHVSRKSKPAIFIDLNESEDEESKPGDCPSSLPWLKRNPSHANGPTVTDLNQPLNDCEIVETRDVKKILGFPIFETGPSENVPSSSASTVCPNDAGKGKRNGMIDINLECEPDEEIDIEKVKTPYKQIDLNSCVSDFEEEGGDAIASVKKIALEIDLEAPVEDDDDTVVDASLQLLQNKSETLRDEVLKNAAETMVAISSFSCPKIDDLQPSDLSLAESLGWFVDAVSDELGDRFPKAMDDFEATTLRLEEMKEEDYMPVPFVPDFQDADETGPTNNALVGRPRRGQSRRGRQRRDFQRDILPGLVSLSRHEVTEDIQTFGGLMRATGHHWVSGSTRRNVGGRGRRRAVVESVSNTVANSNNNRVCGPPLVQQINTIEGWGKTTRRPRRQRCPTGNNAPSAVVLT